MKHNETLALVRKKERGIVLDERYLCNTKSKNVQAGHGCAGALLNIFGQNHFQAP